jgi:hypothetical protein
MTAQLRAGALRCFRVGAGGDQRDQRQVAVDRRASGNIARHATPGRLECFEDDSVAGRNRQARGKIAIPAGVDRFAAEMMGSCQRESPRTSGGV